ncbi:sensor histidine kinase [Maribacter ulvicola]|uniref:histidine kinase n=1 Tax=Maribacter ulvicola TaxID=228959 RepID=A0A1N6ZAV5_9FLAO|nr:sensor histidine kinase [Maribacter ulvicola]SIR23866.1 Signal transduction histidine kinase [Maribacter ulvicola]
MIKKIQSFFILLLFTGGLYAQTPFIRNFPPEEYKAHSQNFATVQDHRGVMYFTNNHGVLEYDGANWRKIKTPYDPRSISMDRKGVIYVGLNGDLGYLQPDSRGRLQFKSLRNKIPKAHQDVKEVWDIVTLGSKVVFVAANKLFILQNDSIDVIENDVNFSRPFVVGNRIYIQKRAESLFSLVGDSLRLLPGSKEHLSDVSVRAMLPYENDNILIVTYEKGIFIFNPKKSVLIRKPKGFEVIDDFLINNKANCGTLLYNGHFAIGTNTKGILVFDKKGKIQNQFNKQNGLQSNGIYFLFTDLNGQLWSSLESGISLIMNNLPFLNYTDKNGLDGSVYSIQKFKNKLYAGTSNNLYIQNKENNFEKIEGTGGQNFYMLQAKEKLLLGNSLKGIFVINDDQALQSKSLKNISSAVAKELHKYPNYIITYVWNKGLALIEYKNEQWVFKHFIKGFDKNLRNIDEDNNGYLWVNANNNLYQLRLNETLDSIIFSKHYPIEQYHLPVDYLMPYRLNDGEIIFGSDKGIYRYISDGDYFEPHPDFSMLTESIYNLNQDASGKIWFEEYKKGDFTEKGVLQLINGEYEIIKTPFYKFTDILISNDYSLYPYSDSLVYFGTNKGILEYHPKQKTNYDIPFNTLIRDVFIVDSLIYGGSQIDSTLISDDPVILKYRNHNLFFHYSATFYEESEKNLFSYRLIGSSDTTWSAWTNKQQKEYTNLPEGNYIFEVKSKNIYRKPGVKAAFAFKIQPPWQRTWWAFSIYGIIAISLVWLLIRINSARLKRQNELLKQTVKERTANIIQQKEELLAKNNKLIELDHFKEGMTGMIVHDLKNPLSTIIGLSKSQEIVQAGNQMLNMVLNILDVQKFEDAQVKLQVEEFHAAEVINDSIKQVQPLYERKSIEVKQNINAKANLQADKEIINRVIVNFLTNAIKYTPNNGSITINADPVKDTDFIKISITDTGEGIPKDKLASVFDKFSQVAVKKSGGVASTGLGLTFCKLAIEAHGGEIGVESNFGRGTTFWFILPKAKAAIAKIIEIDNTTNKELETYKQLTEADRAYLAPFIISLKKFTVYEFSDIIMILNTIKTKESNAVFKWKLNIENAVRACNEEKYNELLK